jgi:hypothetical protein
MREVGQNRSHIVRAAITSRIDQDILDKVLRREKRDRVTWQ